MTTRLRSKRRGVAGSSSLGARVARRTLALFALLCVPGMALAAVTIKGKTSGTAKLLNPVWTEAKDPKKNRFTFREPSATVRPDVRNLTAFLPKELCIAALAPEKGAALKVPLRVVIAGGRTTPVTLVVAEGQQIQFENHDPFPHKLYEVSGKGGFGVAETAPTKTRIWTPQTPGKYEIRDQLSPSIRSWVVVEPRTVAVGYPDKKGDFAIELEPGTYTLRAYFNGEPVGKEMEVVARPGPAEQLLPQPLAIGETSDAGVPAADGGG